MWTSFYLKHFFIYLNIVSRLINMYTTLGILCTAAKHQDFKLHILLFSCEIQNHIVYSCGNLSDFSIWTEPTVASILFHTSNSTVINHNLHGLESFDFFFTTEYKKRVSPIFQFVFAKKQRTFDKSSRILAYQRWSKKSFQIQFSL